MVRDVLVTALALLAPQQKAAAAPANTKAGRYRLPMTRQASTVLSGSSAGKMIRKAAPAAAGFMGNPSSRARPGAWGPPARQLVTAAEGLTQTVMVPGDRARQSGPRLSTARRWSYSPSLVPMLVQEDRAG